MILANISIIFTFPVSFQVIFCYSSIVIVLLVILFTFMGTTSRTWFYFLVSQFQPEEYCELSKTVWSQGHAEPPLGFELAFI